MSRRLRYGLLLAIALGGVLLFMLAAASGNTQAFARNYPVLLAINGVIAALLFLLVVALVLRVARRWRAGRFGARLMARFALAFALMGVVPGVLIYVVSVQFLSRSIESWFDVRVDRALESGLSLGRAVLESQLADLTAKARAIAVELADAPDVQLQALDRMRERAGVHEALVLGGGGQVLAASGALGPAGTIGAELMPTLPTPAALRQARVQRSFQAIEGDELSSDPQTGLRTRVIVPIPAASSPAILAPPASSQRLPSTGPGLRGDGRADARGNGLLRPPPRSEARFLQLVQRVSPSVAAHAEALRSGYREHQELSLARTGLRRIYTVTLTLTLLLAVFAAIASGVLLASSMTAPLLQVAEGTKAVAEGDYRPVREFRGNDELNVLTQSFNAMTRQLAEARNAVEARSRELENARAYLERVLANLSAGVVVLDSGFRLVSANHGASRILGVPMATRAGERFADVVPTMAEQVASAFADQALSATPKDSWQQQLQVPRAGSAPGAEPLALLARGSRLPLEGSMGYVIVFDDITQVISAQRALAWGEVARRLAHEIKNPLTPIQLAAERLRMKLADKLPPEQADVLVRGASTIVSQVAAMKRMVDDFRDYARVPPARLQPLDLNALIAEIAALYGVDGTGGGASAPVAGAAVIELRLAPALPPIEGDPTQLRQVLHNLIVNAQDALAASARPGGGAGDAAGGRIVVRTSLVTIDERSAPRAGATEHGARAVRLTIEDNGPGFPANILRRAFEPYVTTKPSGTGLGLAMVKKIVDEHGARVELVNRAAGTAGGATVIIVFRRLAQDAAQDDAGQSRQRAA